MSLSVYFIEGNTKTACRNDAYSVIDETPGKTPKLLGIFAVSDIGPDTDAEQLREAFVKTQGFIDPQADRQGFREELVSTIKGLKPAP